MGSNTVLMDTLGRTIDCTKKGVDPFSAQSILEANQVTRAVKWGTIDTWSYLQGALTLAKPSNVVATYLGSGASSDVFAEDGANVIREIEADVKISAKYMGVSAKAGASFAYNDNFKHDRSYAFMTNSADLYSAALVGNMNDIWDTLEDKLKNAMLELPDDHHGNEKAFKRFVSLWGTHLVSNVTYGTRFELIISCSNANKEVAASFKANVQAEYGGVVGSAEGSAEIKTKGEYKEYQKDRNMRHILQGGDPEKFGALNLDPTNKAAAKAWASSSRGVGFEALVHMDTIPLGDLLTLHDDEDKRAIGRALNEYIHYEVRGNEIQYIPRNPDEYGPLFIAWSPAGGIGTLTLKLKNDEMARFVEVSQPELLSEDQTTIRVPFTDKTPTPSGRWYNDVRFGIECGVKGTDVEIASEGCAIMAALTTNHDKKGRHNPSSPFNFVQEYYNNRGESKTFSNVNLGSRGASVDRSKNAAFRVE